MKILGKKSLSSIINIFLKILFILCIIAIISGGFIAFKNFKLLMNSIIGKTLLIIYLSGIPAGIMLIQFIGIFKGLKEEKIFDEKNIKRLKISSICSILMGIMYVINSVALIFSDMTTELLTLYLIFTYTLAIVFLIFGIGLVVLNEIYKKAIHYKEENDLTI